MSNESACRYTLVTNLHKPSIDAGETITCDLFIVGSGAVQRSQIFVGHSNPNLVDENIGSVKTSLIIDENDEIVYGDAALDHARDHTDDLSEAGGHYSFDNRYFETIDYDLDEIEDLDFGVSFLETRHDTHVPLQFQLPTSENAKPGDYTIPLVLTYESEESVLRQTKEPISIHINDAREQWEPWPTYARIAIAVIGTVSLMLTAVSVALTAGLL